MKEKIMNDVVREMTPHLSGAQADLLQDALNRALSRFEVREAARDAAGRSGTSSPCSFQPNGSKVARKKR